jgi:hypothetical protein
VVRHERVPEPVQAAPGGRRRGRHGGAALGEGALPLVRVLVPPQRLRRVELALAVVALEQPAPRLAAAAAAATVRRRRRLSFSSSSAAAAVVLGYGPLLPSSTEYY